MRLEGWTKAPDTYLEATSLYPYMGQTCQPKDTKTFGKDSKPWACCVGDSCKDSNPPPATPKECKDKATLYEKTECVEYNKKLSVWLSKL
jgi:hypothetical protein